MSLHEADPAVNGSFVRETSEVGGVASLRRPLRSGTGHISPELLAAQARLLALREEQGVRPGRSNFQFDGELEARATSWTLRNGQRELERRRGGKPHTKRTKSTEREGMASLSPQSPNERQSVDLPSPQSPAPGPQTIIAHPSMLMAMLRQKKESAGRLWLLLRAIDVDGRGWVDMDEVRSRLTGNRTRLGAGRQREDPEGRHKALPLRFCGWKRLQQLLAEGEGLYWTRGKGTHDGRLWLHGAAKVAAALGVDRLAGQAVDLPVAALTGGMKVVRANFYAAFHSGRPGESFDKPISRDTLTEITSISPRTQADYDRIAHVGRRRNMAVGGRYSQKAFQERAWTHGTAVFKFVDANGRQGRNNAAYVAWHLPNSYEGPFTRRSRGNRKRLNRQLADLVNKGIPGNDGSGLERVFFSNGSAAAKGLGKEASAATADAYWPGGRARGGSSLWYVLEEVGR